MLAGVITIIAILMRNPPRVAAPAWFRTTPAIIMMIFAAWFWIGYSWALDKEQHFPVAVMVTKYLLVFFMVYRLIDTPAKAMQFLAAHLAGCFYLGYVGYTTHTGGRLDGVGGPGIDDASTLGMHVSTGVIAGAILALGLKNLRLLACIIAIGISLNVVFLAASRGAVLGLAAGAVVLTLLYPRVYKQRFKIYAILGCVLIGILASQQFLARMETIGAVTSDNPNSMDGSARSRIVMAQAQLKMAKLYPFGAGHRGSEFLSPKFLDPQYLSVGGARSSHNSFLTVWVEQGIPGVVLFFCMVAWVLTQFINARIHGSSLVRRSLIDKEAINKQACIAVACSSLAVVITAGMFADFSKCEVQIWMFALLASLSVKEFKLPEKGRSVLSGA
jgi:O-antigen ligase